MEALETLASDPGDSLWGEFHVYKERFQDLIREPLLGEPDKRIKVAIIDNGVDGIRSSVKEMIAKGISYVAAGPYTADQDQTLPWWMVADPHGTHMASLVGQINPNCRLYIARVGKGRADIQVEHAIKVSKASYDDLLSVLTNDLSRIGHQMGPGAGSRHHLDQLGEIQAQPELQKSDQGSLWQGKAQGPSVLLDCR